jgi:hypothetical protein
MSFEQIWIDKVMLCVNSGGYPVSPYLFLFSVEGLSSLMKKELKGVRNCITSPAISHLLFVDDTIFFARADLKSINLHHQSSYFAFTICR